MMDLPPGERPPPGGMCLILVVQALIWFGIGFLLGWWLK